MDKDLLLSIGLIATLIVLLAIAGILLLEGACRGQALDLELKSQWSITTGCQVEITPEQWIPLDEYRYTENDAYHY